MSGRHLLPHVLAVAIIGGSCLPVFAADEYTPRPQRTFVEKPRIEDYADYNAFLVDIMEYRRQKQERQASRAVVSAGSAAAAAAGNSLSDDSLASVSGQRNVDLRELYDIREPESLEEALERAKKLPHPVYEEQERFGRTTSASFPMPQMDGDDMSIREISGLLQDMESLTPEVFRDSGDEDQAARVLAKNPTNEDDAAEIKAVDSVDGLFRPFYEIGSRMLTGSDGKTVWAPLFIDGEAGVTIVRRFDIEVGLIKTN